jgi:hypothetical protein
MAKADTSRADNLWRVPLVHKIKDTFFGVQPKLSALITGQCPLSGVKRI